LITYYNERGLHSKYAEKSSKNAKIAATVKFLICNEAFSKVSVFLCQVKYGMADCSNYLRKSIFALSLSKIAEKLSEIGIRGRFLAYFIRKKETASQLKKDGILLHAVRLFPVL